MARALHDLQRANTISSNTLFLVELDPDGIHLTRAISAQTLFANVTFNVTSSANIAANNLNVTGDFVVDTVTIANNFTPNTSADVVEGRQVWFDSNYLYVSTADNVIKRVALSTF